LRFISGSNGVNRTAIPFTPTITGNIIPISPQIPASLHELCDLRYGIDTLAAIIETRYHLPLFVPNTLFLFCGGQKAYTGTI